MRGDLDLEQADLYELLGVPPAAKSGEIRAAYRRRARESHPDLNPFDPASGARMTRLNRAARILLDPARRAAYDGARHRHAPSARQRWYDRPACGTDWEAPRAVASPNTPAGRRFSRRVRGKGDALALRTAEWLLALERGECLLLAALCIALGSVFLVWAHPGNAFWTSASDQAEAKSP